MDMLTTYSDRRELDRSVLLLRRLGLAHTVVSPDPAYAAVASPALVLSDEARAAFMAGGGSEMVDTGWVAYRPAAASVPDEPPRAFTEDIVRRVAIVVLAPCVADPDRLRLIAHFSGDTAAVLPYLNAELRQGSYVPTIPALTYMDGRRVVSLFRNRVAIAKAADIVDAWASLERARCLANEIWSRRAEITPLCEARRRPPALEIYRHLPGTNCGVCGEVTCLAFAWAVWRGDADPSRCLPVFEGERIDARDGLLAVSTDLGAVDLSGD